MRTARPEADIPTPPLTLSLVLAAVLRLPSLLQMEEQTRRAGWQQLGWGVVCVLKQERLEIFQEASALRGRAPSASWQSGQRQIQAWAVKDRTCTQPELGPVRVVMTDERRQEVHQVAGQRVHVPLESHWRWMVTRELDGCDEHAIWQISAAFQHQHHRGWR